MATSPQTKDPIGLSAGTNVYAYLSNNAVTETDPYGLLVGVDDMAYAYALITLATATAAYLQSPAGQQAMREISGSIARAIQRQREYDRAKEISDAGPPEGPDECSTLSRQIDHAERVIKLYEAWDARWQPGRHAQKLQDWQNRLNDLKHKHNRRCTQKCP